MTLGLKALVSICTSELLIYRTEVLFQFVYRFLTESNVPHNPPPDCVKEPSLES